MVHDFGVMFYFKAEHCKYFWKQMYKTYRSPLRQPVDYLWTLNSVEHFDAYSCFISANVTLHYWAVHHCGLVWISWRPKSPLNWFVQQRFHTSNKENIEASHYWPFMRKITQWPQEGSVMRSMSAWRHQVDEKGSSRMTVGQSHTLPRS